MHEWKNTVLKSNDTLEKAILVLEQEALGIVMVSDEQSRLIGTVTDGDVRRALIDHKSMSTRLSKVMYDRPSSSLLGDSKDNILSLMKDRNLIQIPVVDENNIIVGLELLQNCIHGKPISRIRDNPVFLMAGGFGKRLRPLTNDTPKPLLKVGPKPILETILTQFINAGFHEFYISTHYKAEMVREHFGDGNKWNVRIQYVHEDQPLGTAGALGLLPKGLSDDLPVIVMNGDLLTKVNFNHLLDFHNDHSGIATMCAREYSVQVPYGVIQANSQRITSIVEKPMHKFFVNAGIYVLNSELFKNVCGTTYLDMPHLLEQQIENGAKVNFFPLHEYWLDIGQLNDFHTANTDFHNHF